MADPIKLGARGSRADDLQKAVDRIVANREFKWRKVPIDGWAGDATFKSAHLALWLIGGSEDQLRKIRKGDVITDHAFRLLIGKAERSDAMKKRDRQRRDEAAELRRQHKLANTVAADGTAEYVSPAGVRWRVAGWMVGAAVGPDGQKRNWLRELQQHGWPGELYSGFRPPAYSRGLCENICGAPSCPGICAGEASNHSQVGPPNWGAIDVQSYEAFVRACAAINAPFRNNLPADRPHRSYTGY
jgi:hypothetical protein